MPALNLIVQQYNYQPQETGYCSSDVQPVLPTKEELSMANQYNDQIPNYVFTSEGDGVIKDLSSDFSEQYYNNPPPSFTSMGGNVTLSKSQINTSQNISMTPNYLTGNYNAASNAPGYTPPI